MTSARRFVLTTIAAVAACAPASEDPGWLDLFGYSPSALHSFEILDFGFPFVPVEIAGDTLQLLFDTGNMAGLSLSSGEFHSLGLPCSDEWDLLDSGGKLVSTGCVAEGVAVSAFGGRHGSVPVLEFFDESLSGLVGPDLLPGTRFTMDYGSRLLAADSSMTPPEIPRYVSIPLVRSAHDPYLILVEGTVNGQEALIEIDTGKSRTTIDHLLAEALSLDQTENGVRVDQVGVGPRHWRVSSARVVDTSGISEGLPRRVSLGIGSDTLDDFVFTVDYAAGLFWMEDPGR